MEALRYFFEFLTKYQYKLLDRIIIDYNSVRPKGEELKTFGGFASGHQSLKRMFAKIDELLKDKNENPVKLEPIDAMDIANIIAENVVSGGVRRSSQICLFDQDDDDIAEAKSDLYTQENGEWKLDESISHRQMSNNTIMYNEKPSREELHEHLQEIRHSGEPGFLNVEEAKRRREDFEGVNPCSEILLDSKGVCNLTSLNVRAFVKDGKLDYQGLFKAQKLSARAAYRMSLLEFELPEWDRINKRDRLVGLSMTGFQDAMNALGWNDFEVKYDENDMPVAIKETEGLKKQRKLLRDLKEVAHQTVREYAEELGDNVPKLVTTVKPEGTQSQMPTVSSGLHFSHSPYYIRRIRISSTDPLVKVAIDLGYNVEPVVGEDPADPDTMVIEFPVRAPEGKVKKDVTAIEQLEIYKMFMREYVDHNASITVHVRDHEWEAVEEWLWNNWDCVVGVSFVSYDDSFYKQMPYEKITRKEYMDMIEDMSSFKSNLVNKYEQQQHNRTIDDSSCESGLCPVR